jgi:carbon starvation protein
MGRTSWYPSVLISSAIVVGGWGYFLYIGVHRSERRRQHPVAVVRHRQPDARGHRAVVATAIIVKQGKLRYAWVTGVPLAWLAIITSTAAWQKISP